MGRDPELWPEPLAFRPERFAEKEPSQFLYPVFNAGPRLCLGARYLAVAPRRAAPR
jgi:cytochrome P450